MKDKTRYQLYAFLVICIGIGVIVILHRSGLTNKLDFMTSFFVWAFIALGTFMGFVFFCFKLLEEADPWRRMEMRLSHKVFGPGYRKKWKRYLKQKSMVRVQTVEDICQWLMECLYKEDRVLFGVNDFWQHPSEFEGRREGDCEDHALWAWMKLVVDLRMASEFVCGHWWNEKQERWIEHAWVIFRKEKKGELFLLESVCKKGVMSMVRPLREVKDQYVPDYSVDGKIKTFDYVGRLSKQIKTSQRFGTT